MRNSRNILQVGCVSCAGLGEDFRLKVPRATALFESRLAAREETTAVREEHFENCSSLRLPLQKLFDVLMCRL